MRVDLNTLNGDETVDSVLTKTKKKTLNPVWEEEFIFRVSKNILFFIYLYLGNFGKNLRKSNLN